MSDREGPQSAASADHHPIQEALHETEREARETTSLLTAKEPPSLIEAMGGPRGMTESAAPTLAFVIATTAGAETKSAAIIAVGLALVAAAARLVRRDTPFFAILGVVGVAISAWLASRTGEARNFFVPGFFLNGGYALLMIGTVVARRPAIGYAVAGFGGSDRWWEDPVRLRVFRTVTLLWAGIFLLRLVVQVPLYLADETVALGTARLVMGYPIFGLGLLLSWRLIQPITKRDARPTEPA